MLQKQHVKSLDPLESCSMAGMVLKNQIHESVKPMNNYKQQFKVTGPYCVGNLFV